MATPLLLDIFDSGHIIIKPEDEEKSAVLKSLIKALVDSGGINSSQAGTVTRLVNERETIGSTAIGDGIALPHARVKFTDRPVGAFALLEKGSGFSSLDGAPVKYVFLLLTPKDDDALHIATLKGITTFTREHIHLKALSGCSSAEEVVSVFKDYA